MQKRILGSALAGAVVLSALGAMPAQAQVSRMLDENIGCDASGNGKDIFDVIPQVALNYFGPVNQQIGAVVGVYTTCDPHHKARWTFDTSASVVSQPGGISYAGRFGVGYEFKLNDWLLLVPLARFGFDHFPNGETDAIEEGEIAMEANLKPFDNKNIRLILDDTPSYTGRQSATTTLPGPGTNVATFSNLFVGSVDFRLCPGWRMKTSLAYNYIANNAAVNSIGSLIVSARDEENGVYSRSFEIEYSRGNGNFDGVVFSIDFHWL